MPAYTYRCGSCATEIDEDYPIGTAPKLLRCPVTQCGGTCQQVLGQVHVAPSALETKGAQVRKLNRKDRAWHADMPAYKRMRDRGLQPQQIDGASTVENEVGDNFDIEYKARLQKAAPDEPYESTKQRVREGLQQVREMA